MCFLGVAVPAQLPGITFEGRQNVLNTGLTNVEGRIPSGYAVNGEITYQYNAISAMVYIDGLKNMVQGEYITIGTLPEAARPQGNRTYNITDSLGAFVRIVLLSKKAARLSV